MIEPFDDPEILAAMARHGVVHRPGMAQEVLAELAPLLAAEGIDLDDPDPSLGIDELNAALARATERRNLEIATPVGEKRTLALAVLRSASIALADARPEDAAALLASIEPEGREDSPAVSHVIGAGLGALDTWFAEPGLGRMLAAVRVPRWRSKPSRNAATDILALARKHRAFDSLHSLIVRYAGLAVFEGTVLVVAGALAAIAERECTDVGTVSARLLTVEAAPTPTSAPQAAQGTSGSPTKSSAFGGGTGAAFGASPLPTAADHEMLGRFGSWLEREPHIAAPSVEIELAMFTHLLGVARGNGLDLGRPKEALQFSALFFDADEPAAQLLNPATTMDDYLHFQLDTAKDPGRWEKAHEFIEELLEELQDEIGDPLDSVPAVTDDLIRLIAEANELDSARRLAVLSQTPPITGVRELLGWVGKRRRITQTGAVRRDDIREVSAMLGIDAIGVAKRAQPMFDGEDRRPTLQASSMWQIPELTAWWESLVMTQVITTNTSSVAPGEQAGTWLSDEHVPLEAAEDLVAFTIANLLVADTADSGFFPEFALQTLALTIARLLAALLPEQPPLEQPDDGDFRSRIMFGRSSSTMRSLERLRLVELDAQGEPVVEPELRGVVAHAIMLALARFEPSEDDA